MITLTIEDSFYPPLLREIDSPPAVLYLETKLAPEKLFEKPCLAVVGARKATNYGKIVARKMTEELAKKGFTIVSGLAKGIDICAHLTALENKGLTIAVLGSGLDRLYPPEHKKIAGEIAEKGALISEFPPGTRARPEFFPRRNRIIAGLSLGVLVCEAAERSGSLITASFAADFGREVFAIPGPVDSLYSRGTAGLIKKGAKLTENIDDILEELNLI